MSKIKKSHGIVHISFIRSLSLLQYKKKNHQKKSPINDSIEFYPLIRIHVRGQIINKIKRNCFVPVQDMKEDKLRMQYLVELM